jgi:hypothetical protein
MCFAALAPAAAMTASDQDDWVEICTAQGMRWVALEAGVGAEPASPADAANGHLERCPWCSLAGHVMAPPPALGSTLRLKPQRLGPPPRYLSAARTAHVWCSAQARAPPHAT